MSSRSAAAIAAVTVLWLCGSAPVRAAGSVGNLEQQIRAGTLERAHRQADALVRDPALHAIARSHSAAMYRVDRLAHVLPDHVTPESRVACDERSLFGLVSENVGYLRSWPRDANLARLFVDAWMASPGHRRNILASYRILEVGCHGDATTMYCTQNFVRSAYPLKDAVPRRLASGQRLTLRLRRSAGADSGGWRAGVAAASGDGEPSTAPFHDGAATVALPEAAGWYRLSLWIPEQGQPGRFRVIGGPYLQVGNGASVPGGPCPSGR